MVVLEAGMLTSAANQYLQPDYLSPLSTTLDAKKSPLALLAQTCSQIGADGPPAKSLSMERPSKKTQRPSSASQDSTQKRGSPSTAASTTTSGSPSTSPHNSTPPAPAKLAFKPYEANVLSRREDRPPSKSGSETEDRKSAPLQRKSSSPAATTSTPTSSPAAASADRKSSSPANASPIIRSGLEVLQGHPKDLPLGTYKPGSLPTAGLTAAQIAQLCCPPGYDPTHPAFRPPFAGAAAAAAFSHQQAAALLAAGYGSPAAAAAAAAAATNPYISYARVKTPTGGEALVPVCKDPYCAGCPFSMHGAMLAASGAAAAAANAAATPCPAGCTQCEHQKWMPPPTSAYSSATAAASAAAAAHQLASRPYICNWVGGESYCGKRFTTSEELLVHLRNHTTPMTPGAPGSSSAAAAAAAAATSSYPSARFHPYSKPGFPAGLPASPYSAFNPTALGPYYSPYALYGQRIGAAVHP